MDASLSETERDRVPYFRQFRDLSRVSTPTLERIADDLVSTIQRMDYRRCRALYLALVDIEVELVDRTIEIGRRTEPVKVPVRPLPSSDVVRITHRSGRSGLYFQGGAS